ncbi:GntR family transcriptional regulator [Microbacterium aerolatum]|uniref:Transcriptional regulator n=1 Tax=Microbacterium aerolatum TaxID=153731 RepID=A0A511AE81_9MICO|nr:GntR family transcriptional regulator [Microbacterium aerolatum]GEK86474.1 transcriptional regulator [Microbacterium aerolatum]GGB23161.1 transcriptional regulator [Microbacterium aerolatum]
MASHTPRSVTPISMVRVARPSTVDLITAELRKAIFTGALPVGSPIGEVEMSSQLGVSRSPLRESTQRLVQEGLLTASPGRGMRVSVIGPEHVADVYDARLAIEAQAARLIIKTGASAVIGSIERAYATLVEASKGEDAVAIGDADIEFHRLLVDSAGSRRLSHYMSTLVIETRIASFSDPNGYTVRRSISETYRQLLDALAAGDTSAAFAALEQQFAEAVARLTGEDEDVDTVERPVTEAIPTMTPIEFTDEV